MKAILIAVFVTIVILVECVTAYYLVPSAASVEKAAQEKAAMAKKTEEEEKPAASEVELDLGKYNVTVHRPSLDTTMRVSFHLVGTAADTSKEEFTGLYARNQHRLREQILVEIRNAKTVDLTDPGLGLIKRRILAKSNELLGKPILTSVLFSEFTYVEQ